VLILCLLGPVAAAQDKPNIVLVFMDNFGWGEPGFNGGGIIPWCRDSKSRFVGR
jgi:arylsulfatase